MRRKWILFTVLTAAGWMAAGLSLRAQTATPATPPDAKVEIRHLLDTYLQSVDEANATLGAKVWLTTPDATFIHPLGHEWGWNQIAADVYGKLMGQMFTQRELKIAGEPTIHIYGNSAVVEYDWDFVATMRANGQVVHTSGRESQVYVNLPDKGWRLVHVHYSGPPEAGPSPGF
jgi:hypothetical protein